MSDYLMRSIANQFLTPMRSRYVMATMALWLGCFVAFAEAQLPSNAVDRSATRSADLEQVERSIETLNNDVFSEDASVRRRAIKLLGAIRAKLGKSAGAIAGRLSDQDPDVRIAAVDALLKFDDPWWIRQLLAAISDQDPRVQFRAVVAVHRLASRHRHPPSPGGLRGPIVVPNWYEREVDRNKDRAVRGLLALACEQESPDIAQAIPKVMQCLGDGGDELFDAAYLILPVKSVASELGKCLSHDGVHVRRGAARMLFELETGNRTAEWTKSAIQSLTSGLNDTDGFVRLYCLLTYSKHRSAKLTPLIRLAQDPDAVVRCAAIDALVRRHPKRAFDVLDKLLRKDSSVRVRVRAAFALASLSISDAQVAKSLADRLRDQYTAKTRGLIQIASKYHSEEEENEERLAVSEDLDAAIPEILAAIREERTRPLPEFENLQTSDQLETELLFAIGAIGSAAEKAVPLILEDLRAYVSMGSGDYRADTLGGHLQSALYTLSRINATKELARALKDRHVVVRTTAAMALSGNEEHAETVVPILIESLGRECWGVCTYSHTLRADVSCLAESGHHAVPALLTEIRRKRATLLAKEAIGGMAADDDRVLRILGRTLEDASEQQHVRVVVAEMLATVGRKHPPTRDLLAQTLRNEKEPESIRVAAAKGLGRLGPKARSILEASAKDKSAVVRAAVLQAIRESREQESP